MPFSVLRVASVQRQIDLLEAQEQGVGKPNPLVCCFTLRFVIVSMNSEWIDVAIHVHFASVKNNLNYYIGIKISQFTMINVIASMATIRPPHRAAPDTDHGHVVAGKCTQPGTCWLLLG